jgi:type II secretory pathway component GspD/PulD (secretin)
MINQRVYHTASVLLNGKVLVSGGYSDSNYINSAELYDPSSGIWTATGSMNNNRSEPRALVLSDGKVLVIGGFDDTF